MSKQILIAAGLAAALIGVSCGAPSIGYAITITSITVTQADGTAFCDSTGACANKVWNLGGGVTINNGASLTRPRRAACSTLTPVMSAAQRVRRHP